MEKKIQHLLNDGEQLRWAGKPVLGKLMDDENRRYNMWWFIISGVIVLGIIIAYFIAVIRAGTGVMNLLTLFLVLLGGLILLDPFTSFLRLKSVVYAVSTKKIIVCRSETNHFELPLEQAEFVDILPGENGLGTLYIGVPGEKIKPYKKRSAGMMGYRVDSENSSVNYPVFYNIENAEEVKALIESLRKENASRER